MLFLVLMAQILSRVIMVMTSLKVMQAMIHSMVAMAMTNLMVVPMMISSAADVASTLFMVAKEMTPSPQALIYQVTMKPMVAQETTTISLRQTLT